MPVPHVSICIPAYNAERFLPATLRSVAAQRYRDWELIVVNDASRDGTARLVEDFAREVPQVVTCRHHAVNRGLPLTRNTGIEAARGTWIAIVDADDLWLPDHLDGLVAVADDDTALAYSGCMLFDDATGADLEPRAPSPENLRNSPLSLYRGELIIQPSTVLIRKTVFDRVGGFSPEYPICNDLEMWLRIARSGGRFAYSGRTSCRYRKHAAAMSRKSAALIAEVGRICEAYAEWDVVPSHLRRARPAELYRNAGRILLRSEPLQARHLLAQSLRLRKCSPLTWLFWLRAAQFAARQPSPTPAS